jgi:hypothetical protein
MNRILCLILTLIALTAASLCAADVSGDWTLKGEIAGIAFTAQCSFKQDSAAKLEGSCKTSEGPDTKTTGEVTDKKVVFQYEVEYEGQMYTLVYTGNLDPETEMKGTIEAGGAVGDFEGKKSTAAAAEPAPSPEPKPQP